MRTSGIITLTTDFGLQDPYVGIMKGVLLSICPTARIIDISHRVRPGAIFEAASLIQDAYPFFPKRTIHVGVIDPGVGGKRRPIIVDTGGHIFVGPDNGLFWPIIRSHKEATITHLTKKTYFLSPISQTFHGRDIFAPVAGHLTRGVDPSDMGPIIDDPTEFAFPEPNQEGSTILGQVIRVDRFGNLITNIGRDLLEPFPEAGQPIIRVGDLIIEGISKTYSEVGEGGMLALIGSSDRLEISANLGRACDRVAPNSNQKPKEIGEIVGEIVGMEVEVRKV